MKKNIKLLLFVTALLFLSAGFYAEGIPKYNIDPHDSLLFDGGSFQSIDRVSFYEDVRCYTKVEEVQGNVMGVVVTKEIVKACGEDETLYVATERLLKKGDKLMTGSDVKTGADSRVDLGIYTKETGFNASWQIVRANSWITTPDFLGSCKNTYEPDLFRSMIKVIEGVITYDSPPDSKFKATTKGKRASANHKKTRYSHEVKIDGSDTVDVIRVYKGSVEVSMENIEDPNSGEMEKNIEKLGEDLQSGKISAEEMQEKMKAFQFYGQNLNELIQPLNVDEGFKCTVTKSTRVVEPLGPGDEDIK